MFSLYSCDIGTVQAWEFYLTNEKIGLEDNLFLFFVSFF